MPLALYKFSKKYKNIWKYGFYVWVVFAVLTFVLFFHWFRLWGIKDVDFWFVYAVPVLLFALVIFLVCRGIIKKREHNRKMEEDPNHRQKMIEREEYLREEEKEKARIKARENLIEREAYIEEKARMRAREDYEGRR